LNSRLLKKLAGLTLAEAAFRTTRQYRILADLVPGNNLSFHPDTVLTDGPATPETYKAQWDRKTFFYFSPSDRPGLTDIFENRFPEKISSIRQKADSITRGYVTIFGKQFSCPAGDSWKQDPVTGHAWPDKHWSSLDVVASAENIDPKYVWEINRHQFLIPAAMAFWFTRDEVFADFTVKTLLDWIDHNPCGMGINWVESLEAATRLVAWVWILELLRGARVLTSDRLYKIFLSMAAHARHISRYLSCYLSPNTHLTGESWGLFVFSAVYPEVKDSQKWRKLSETILVQELMRQVGDDGVHRELSTCYHAYTAEYFFQYLILNSLQGRTCPAPVMARLEKMCNFFLYCQTKDNTLPMLGDGDSGQALPLDPSGHNPARIILAHGTLLFNSTDMKHQLTGLPWEALWFWGKDAVNRFEQVPARMEKDPCFSFQDANYMVSRTGWGEQDSVLVFDAGNMGFLNSGHAHADFLHFDLAVSGRPVIVDTGTGSYHDPFWRNHFRGTAAHNTVTIDQQPQAAFGGKFNWTSKPDKGKGRLIKQSCFTLFCSEYTSSSMPVSYRHLVHQRIFCQWETLFFLCLDTICSDNTHNYAFHYHFHPEINIRLTDTYVSCTHQEKNLLTMVPMFPQTTDKKIFIADKPTGLGHYSPDYGRIVPAACLRIQENTPGSFSRGMLMLPGSLKIDEKQISWKLEDNFMRADFQTGPDYYRLCLSETKQVLTRDNLDLTCACLLEKITAQGDKTLLALEVGSLKHNGKKLFNHSMPYALILQEKDQTLIETENQKDIVLQK
jgi:hypothetical protein